MFLTKTELTDLTSYKLKKKQVQWLRSRGYKHEISACGDPKVLRSYIENVLGNNAVGIEKRSKPNFAGLESLSHAS